MKIGSSGNLILILVISAIAIGGGYWYSNRLHTDINEIWKQTLWEDCANRMREIKVKKKHTFSSTTSSDIKIETKDQTVNIKRNSSNSLSAKEGSFLADQQYLSLKNPINIENIDNLFGLKLKENGYDFKTAVSICTHSEPKRICGLEDLSLLPQYLKLTYKVSFEDAIVLKGYVKGNWLNNLLWSKSYYIILSIIAFVALILLVIKKAGNKSPKYLLSLKQPDILPAESVWQEVEHIPEPIEIQPIPEIQPKVDVIYLNENKHELTYSGKLILLTPKVFALLYQLSQGENYFQSYESLLKSIWTEKDNPEKKHLEQLVIRLRKDLKNIPGLNIESIRGSGYQLKRKKTFTFRPTISQLSK